MEKRRLKVCGMRDATNILDVAAVQPDFMGFIFYDQSNRFVGTNFTIPKGFPRYIKKVGVFVNENLDRVLELVRMHQLDFVQLHGDEAVHFCAALRKKIKVIKVFRVDNDFDFRQTKDFEDASDYFLFDTKTTAYGGSGKSFDWNLLNGYNGSTPFFLSGGINAENFSQAMSIKHAKFFALDINSGAETSPGKKDPIVLSSMLQILNYSS